MRSDGEATRARIMTAARAEFIERGLAGARVDRIAAAADASKERLYAYFGDKRALYAAVLDHNLQEVMRAIPLDANNLPGFAGAVFDHVTLHPDHMRMVDWARLEGDLSIFPVTSVPLRDREAIRAAQENGQIDASFDPQDLIDMLFALATAWVRSPEAPADTAATTRTLNERRRAAVVSAARKLIEPRPLSSS
jgi:AcrR family transcriptional regulator